MDLKTHTLILDNLVEYTDKQLYTDPKVAEMILEIDHQDRADHNS